MRATLEFDLDDPKDNRNHMRCAKSLDVALCLWNITHNNQKLTKHEILKKMNDVLTEYNIDFEEIGAN